MSVFGINYIGGTRFGLREPRVYYRFQEPSSRHRRNCFCPRNSCAPLRSALLRTAGTGIARRPARIATNDARARAMGPVIIANKTFPVSRSRAGELRTRTRTERHARSVRINLSHYLRLRYRAHTIRSRNLFTASAAATRFVRNGDSSPLRPRCPAVIA